MKLKKFLTPFSLIVAALLTLIIFPSTSFCEESAAPRNGLFADETMTLDELYQWTQEGKNFLLFDARDEKTYKEGHIKGAKLPLKPEYYKEMELFRTGIIQNAPDYDQALKAAIADYPKDVPIVTYCNNNCHAAAVLALRLIQQKVPNVKAMEEGYQTWQSKGYPTEKS